MKTAALRIAIDQVTFYLMLMLLTFYITKPIVKELIKISKKSKFEEEI